MSDFTICLLITIASTIAIMLPFFVGKGGALAASSSISKPEELENLKQIILERYIKDEKALANGSITEQTWKSRQKFLTNRYIDAAKRLDFLKPK